MVNPTDINWKRNSQTAKNKGFNNYKEYQDNLVKCKGFDNTTEYKNSWAKSKGFENCAEYCREHRWNKGIIGPMSENESCSLYKGIYIGESQIAKHILEMIFECVDIKPPNNPGFDFICRNPRIEFIEKYPIFEFISGKEYRIDSKIRKLEFRKNYRELWNFPIRYNNIADYFILIGISNGNDDNEIDILYIWFFKKDDIIRGRKLWRREMFSITNSSKCILRFHTHELKDELEEIKKIVLINK